MDFVLGKEHQILDCSEIPQAHHGKIANVWMLGSQNIGPHIVLCLCHERLVRVMKDNQRPLLICTSWTSELVS
jgi:hypothetical protein